MPDIRAEDRVELRPERIVAAERGSVHPVVRLAAEICRLSSSSVPSPGPICSRTRRDFSEGATVLCWLRKATNETQRSYCQAQASQRRVEAARRRAPLPVRLDGAR